MFKVDNAAGRFWRQPRVPSKQSLLGWKPSGTGRIFPTPASFVASVRQGQRAPRSLASAKFFPVATAS